MAHALPRREEPPRFLAVLRPDRRRSEHGRDARGVERPRDERVAAHRRCRSRPLPARAMSGALAGIRVLDIADRSGALAGKLLAGLGADVVSVEPPGGASLRRTPPFWQGIEDPERSLFHWFYATGKRSVVLDRD